MRNKSVCFTFLSIVLLNSFAAYGEKHISCVTISKNSTTIAFFLNEDKHALIEIVEPRINKRIISIGWCNISKPDDIKRIRIDTLGKEFSGWGGEPAPKDIKFSPDSQKIAVLTPNKISIVNLKTNKPQLSIDTRRQISTFQWLSDTEIGYVEHETPTSSDYYEIDAIGYDSASVSRSFWQQKINSEDKKLIYKDSGECFREFDFGGRFPTREQSEYWSPNGEYVIYVSNFQFRLLDVKSKKVRFIKRGRSETIACWKSDSSTAFCTSDDNHVAFFVIPKTGETKDYSNKLKESISGTYKMHPLGDQSILGGLSLESWTYDNKFLIFNGCLGPGGYLIQLEPWQTIETKSQLAKHMKFVSPPYLLQIPLDDGVEIYSPGVSVAKYDKKGNIYEVNQLIPDAHSPGTFSPNRKYLVFSTGWKLRVHKLAPKEN